MKMQDLIKSAAGSRNQSIGTRLQAGDIVDLDDTGKNPRVHLVFRVNECRACLLPMTGTGTVEAAATDYNIHPKMFGISPDSDVIILKRLGKAGMIDLLENQHKNKQTRKENAEMSKNNKAAKTEKAEEAPKLGKLGGFLGYSLTSVIRAMGKLGWEYWEAMHVFNAEKIPVAENTIRIQLAAGKRGQGGEPAPISAELKKLRPDASEKPVRKSNGDSKKGKKAKAGKAAKAEAKSSKKDKSSKKEKAPEPDEPDTDDDAADESPE